MSYAAKTPKPFESPDITHAAVAATWGLLGFRSNDQAARVFHRHPETIRLWRTGGQRPDASSCIKWLRLLLWRAEGWPVSSFEAVDWDDMAVTFSEGYQGGLNGGLNPFALSQGSTHKFPYGGPRDRGGIVRDIEERPTADGVSRWGIRNRLHLGALLGISKNHRYETIKRWARSERTISPQYLTRLLTLLVLCEIGAVPDGSLELLWSVDWKERQVTFAPWYVEECWAYGVPDPFDILLDGYAKAPARQKPRKPEVAVPVGPVRTYDPRELVAQFNGTNGAAKVGPGQLLEAAAV